MDLLIFTAPSGAGKTTIVRHLLSKYDHLAFSVSATTREKRAHEEHGKDYYFLSIKEWKEKIVTDAFAEWEEVYDDQYYGTLKSEINRLIDLGKTVVFDIDVKGAMNIKHAYGDKAMTIFVKPPSPDILFQRLRDRNTETPQSLQKRISRASLELEYEVKCDYVLLNDDLELCKSEAESLIESLK